MPVKKPYFGSTEPQSRKVLEEIKARTTKKKKKVKDTGSKVTAKTPKGVKKTKAQSKKELLSVRARIDARVKAEKANQRRQKLLLKNKSK